MVAVLALAGSGQGGHEHAPAWEATLVAAAIAAMLAALALIARALARRRRRAPRVLDEWQARVVMDELSPGGWRARITIDRRARRGAPVELEWSRCGPLADADAPPRHLQAGGIPAALQALIDDGRAAGADPRGAG